MRDLYGTLEQELRTLIPSLSIEQKEQGLIIYDLSFKDLKVAVDNRLVFYFSKVKDLNPDDISLYLETKLDFSNISNKYLKEESFYLYPSSDFSGTSRGDFQKRMWMLRTIRDAHSALEGLKKDIGL